MTVEELRRQIFDSDVFYVSFFLREIAFQLAELNATLQKQTTKEGLRWQRNR